MYYMLLALVCGVLGAVPLVLGKKPGIGLGFGVFAFLVVWGLSYASLPTTIWPIFGLVGFYLVAAWTVGTIINAVASEESGNPALFNFIVPALYIIMLLGSSFTNSHMLNATSYSKLIGTIEERDWNTDVQPKDPRHMRMVSAENAMYISKKVVASAGAIGSQFTLDNEHMTLQRIKNQLAYVIPFDYNSFSVWTDARGVPGYVIVDAENPERKPELVHLGDGKQMIYTPGAFFSKNLTRHLWDNGFMDQGLAQFRFELDDDGNPWWVVSTYRPTIGWSGEQITGLATVNPMTGEIKRYTMAEAPAWIDRIIPGDFLRSWFEERGEYSGGWLNSWWGKQGLTEPEQPILIYGANDRAEWVTGITSLNKGDDSLLGLMYTDSRTGKTVYYHTSGGGTDRSVIQAVNNNVSVKYKHLAASTPQVYNVYGTMAAVVPLLNSNDAFQGVAIVPINNVQDVAVGDTQSEALRHYQTLVSRHGQQVTLEKDHAERELVGIVDRIRPDTSQNGTVYMFHVAGVPRIFTASNNESPKLSLTQAGDNVKVTFVASGEDFVPVVHFDNLSLPLERTAQQDEVAMAAEAKRQTENARGTAADLTSRIKSMTPEQLKQLEELLKKK